VLLLLLLLQVSWDDGHIKVLPLPELRRVCHAGVRDLVMHTHGQPVVCFLDLHEQQYIKCDGLADM
jgi:hypothetical protein